MTCVGPLHTGQPNPSVMLSGTKDGTITVWDIRQQKAAIHMHVEEAGAEGEPMVCRPLLERCCHAHALQWLVMHPPSSGLSCTCLPMTCSPCAAERCF